MKYKTLIAYLKTTCLEISRLLLGFMIIISLFYIRLVPKVARDLWEDMNYSQILSTTISIIFIILNIYQLLILIGYIKEKSQNAYLLKIKEIFSNFFDYFIAVLHNFYKFIWYMLEFFAHKLLKYPKLLHYDIMRKIAKSFNKKENINYYYFCLISIKLLPKVIFVIAFFMDVIIYHHLDMTFKCIPLLLLPLLEKFFLFTLYDFQDSHKEGIFSFIEREKIIGTDTSNYFFVAEHRDNPPDFVKDFEDFFFNHFLVIRDVYDNILLYKTWKYEKFPYFIISLILCVVRLFLLIYILYYGLR